MIKKAYFEITNICNLNCSFCPGTKRKKEFISVQNFEVIASKLNGKITYLYLHLMGEPTIHPELPQILSIAEKFGFKVVITTNGSTIADKGAILLNSKAVYKVSISLHSLEANGDDRRKLMKEYLLNCFDFCKKAAQNNIISVMRLWNLDGEETVGENTDNPLILEQMGYFFEKPWKDTRGGIRLAGNIFLEYGEKFEWPDADKIGRVEERSEYFCYGLRDHIGILCDGTVVPCCLDSEGTISLGNLLDSDIDEILSSPQAKRFYDCFSARKAPHPLCETCGYARRFAK